MSRRRRCLSGMDMAILRMVTDHPCHGMGTLVNEISPNCWTHTRDRVMLLHEAGLIDLEVPPTFGRGHRIVIRRRG